jgi:hypothetical protein
MDAEDNFAPVEREIGGVNYQTRALPFSEGKKILKRLTDILSPIMSAVVRGGSKLESAAAALDALPAAFTDADIDRFGKTFGNVSSYWDGDKWVPLLDNGKINNQERHFAKRYLEFFKWLIFNIEVNFGDFFNGVVKDSSGLTTLMQTVTGQPQSPVSTGLNNSSSAP